MRNYVFTLTISFLLALIFAYDYRNGIENPSRFQRLINHTLPQTSVAASDIERLLKAFPTQPEKFLHKKNQKENNPYVEKDIQLKIDHFAYDNPKTFKLRYLINDTYFQQKKLLQDHHIPIFFYCGNEGDIDMFWKNSGFITTTLAEEFSALIVFGEHRFFGKSFPFGGTQDYDLDKNKYLTVEQALADYIELLISIKKEYQIENNPVIAMGGSYGGMLAAWGRMKFPHIFAGAIASSAPILLFEDINQISNRFFQTVTETYRRYDNECPDIIRKGFSSLLSLQNSSINVPKEIYTELNEIFKPCKPIRNKTEIKMLEDKIEDAIVNMAQYNYPYETSFLLPLPGEPVKTACERIKSYQKADPFSKSIVGGNGFTMSSLMASSVTLTMNKFNNIDPITRKNLNNLKQVMNVFFNYTGTTECIDIGNNNHVPRDLNGWAFLACTSMIMPMQKNGITDMFNPQPWDFKKFADECISKWKGDIRPEWAFNFYGGRDWEEDIQDYSNILFTRGKMDPWSAGCPMSSSNPEVVVIEGDSGHHLDLRLPHAKDPPSVIAIRNIAKMLIQKWISNRK